MKEDQEPDQSRHVCKLCNRSFRNPKCLDGHMRNHKDAGPSERGIMDDSDHSSNVKIENPERESEESSPKANQCKGCGKEFSSIKALFGHMKCHPELIKKRSRTKRFKSTSISLGSDLESVSHDVQIDSVIEPDTEEAAMILLMLSEGVPFSVENDGVKEWFAEDNLSTKRDKITDENGSDSGKMQENHKSDQISSKCRKSIPCLKKKMKYTCDENTASRKGEYACKTCYMIFTSHRALVGHTSQQHAAHRSSSSSLSKIKLEDITMFTEHEANQETKTHVCSTCLKIFESGRALGGHMRTHYATRTDTLNVNGAVGVKHEQQLVDY